MGKGTGEGRNLFLSTKPVTNLPRTLSKGNLHQCQTRGSRRIGVRQHETGYEPGQAWQTGYEPEQAWQQVTNLGPPRQVTKLDMLDNRLRTWAGWASMTPVSSG